MFHRFLVGLVVLALAASVLAIPPAGAANTAVESLSDHDNNADTAQIRQFGGSNRYATSLALARAFTTGGGSAGFVESVIVASGESLVDAAAAAGLAASESAPVLLVPPGRLSRSVENFIVDEFISEVFIVGGTAAVSQDVEDALAALAPVRTVTRLAGADRYATAVAVANEIRSPGVYCETDLTTALLVNVDSSFADVIAVGPLAYALELPILLTQANALPAAVADYLSAAEIERVVVVGGTAAVSESVVAGINSAGIADVVRIGGVNRYETALEIRRALSECDTIALSPATIALVNGSAAADGVAAGPLLGVGLANDGITPVLLVNSDGLPGEGLPGEGLPGDGLPSETRNYLRSLPTRNADASFVDVSFTAIGGTAVVPDSVVQAAIAAATTSSPITAIITANTGEKKVTVTFSAPVSVASRGADGFATSALNPAHYRVSDGVLFPDDTLVASNGNRTITIGLSGNVGLVENAPISVADGKIKGLGSDNRRVVGTQATARLLAPDNLRPRIDIFAPQGSHAIRLEIKEPNLVTDVSTRTPTDPVVVTAADAAASAAATAAARNALLANIRIGNAPLYVAAAAGTAAGDTTEAGDTAEASTAKILPFTVEPVSSVTGKPFTSITSVTVCLFGLKGAPGSEQCEDTAPTGTAAAVNAGNARPRTTLATGETVTLAARAFVDEAGNQSRSKRQRVGAYANYPRVRRATVTNPVTLDIGSEADPDLQVAQWRWQRHIAATATTPAAITDVLRITAKPDGAASGAAGNGWRVSWRQLPGAADSAADAKLKATVFVNEQRKSILISFGEDTTIFAVASALSDSSAFSESFTVDSDAFDSATANQDLANEKIADPNNLLSTADLECAGVAAPSTGVRHCGRPSTGASNSLDGGVSVVVVTLTYNETLESFDYAGLIAANRSSDTPSADTPSTGFPAAERTFRTGTRDQQLLGWQRDPFGAELDLDNEFAFLLTTDSPTFADLPKRGDRINLPDGLGTTFAPPDCTSGALARIGDAPDNPCGQSIAVIAPGQILRRGTIRGRIEGAQTEVVVSLQVITPAISTDGVGERIITIIFSESVSATALNLAHYQINGNPLPADTTIALSTNGLVVTITLPEGSELTLGATIAVIAGGITSANDENRVNKAALVVVMATGVQLVEPIIATITAEAGQLTITVEFSAPVSGAISETPGFAASARNPAHYQIGAAGQPAALPGTASVALSADGMTATITLQPGDGLDNNAVVSVVGGVIKAANDERLVLAAEFMVGEAKPITADIVKADPGGLEITVRFSERVNAAADGESDFATSALNPAHYQIGGAALPDDATVVYDAGSMTATITLQSGSGLVSGVEITVAGGVITAVGPTDDRRVQATARTVEAARPITAEVRAAAGFTNVMVVFSEAVSRAVDGETGYETSALNLVHYLINDEPLSVNTSSLPGIVSIDLSADGLVVTITLPSGLADNATVSVAGGVITAAGASDDRRVEAGSLTVDAATLITVEEITGKAGTRSIMVRFSEPVNAVADGQPGFATSARNPVHYQIDGAALVGVDADDIELSGDGRTVTITLPPGQLLAEEAVVSVAGGVITAVGVSDDRRVEAASFTVAVLITATIAAEPGGLVITVRFSEPVNAAASGSGAANRAHYQINNAALPDDATVTYDVASRTTTIVLLSGLADNATVSVVGGVITAVGVNDDRRVQAGSLTVGTATLITVQEITAEAGGLVITVRFSEPVDAAASGSGAANRAHYQINNAALPDDATVTYDVASMTTTIVLLSGLADNATVSVVGGVITAVGVNDDRRVQAGSLTVGAATLITVQEITAEAGGLVITVRFSEPVDPVGARSLANYEINGVELAAAVVDEITYDAGSMTTTIVLLSGLADFATVSVAGGVITAEGANDDRRVQTEPLTVGAATLITVEEITAEAGGLEITVRFSESVDPVGARSLVNYEINGVALVVAVVDEVTYDAGSMTTTIVLASGLADNATVSVAGGVITAVGASDDRRVQAGSLTVGAATLITVEEITAEPGGLEITVRFSEPVDPVGARSLASYEIVGVELVAVVDEVVYDAGSRTVRIVLAAGEELVAGDVIRVVGGVISAVGVNDDRRVEADSFPVPTPAGLFAASVEGLASERVFTVTFTDRADPVSARNPASYQINDAPLVGVDAGDIVLSADGQTATITLLSELVGGDTISVVANKIKAAFDGRLVAATSFVVLDAVTATIAAAPGGLEITVTFSAPVNAAASGSGAANRAHYQINNAALPDDATVTYDAASRTTTIVLLSGLADFATVSVADDVINTADAGDDRRVQTEPLTVGAAVLITATIAADPGGLEITVRFSERVDPVGARSLANYEINGVALVVAVVDEVTYDAGSMTTTIVLLSGLADNATVSVAGGVITAVGDSDDRRVQAASLTVGAATLITVEEITAEAGGLEITVRFSEPVDPVGARSLVNYEIDGVALVAVVDEVTYDAGSMTTRIVLAAGEELVAGDVIRVVGGVISAVGVNDDRRVEADSFPVPTPAGLFAASIEGLASERVFTVTFTDRADPVSARNPASYQINDASLPVGTTFGALTNDGTVLRVTLLSELVGGDTISVVANKIKAAFDGRLVAATSFVVLDAVTATIAADPGGLVITVTFSAPVDPVGARSLANYQINDAALVGVTADDIELSGDGLVVTITLLSGLADFATVSVADDVINTADAGDDRRVQTEPLTVGAATLITVEEITAEAGGLEITVRFSESVDPVGARSLVNYQINGVALVTAVVDEITYDAGSMTTTIVLASGLADNATVSVAGGVITAVGASDDRRVEAASLTVGAATLITVEEITAEAGGLVITVRFSERVDPVGARSLVNYQINDAALVGVTADDIELSGDGLVVTIVLLSGLADNATVSVAGGVITAVGANDDRRVEAASLTVGAATLITVEEITAEAGGLVITVRFSERVDPVGARSLASYEINGVALVTAVVDEVVYDAGSMTTRIVLAAGEELVAGDVIRVVGGVISAVGVNDDRRVRAGSFPVPTPAGLFAASVEGLASERVFTVTFTDRADPVSATNPASYQINDAPLVGVDAGDIVLSADGQTATITLLSELVGGDTISVVANKIKAAFDGRLVAATSFVVLDAVTATIAADPGGLVITVTFSAPVDPVGARSLANYQINDAALVGVTADDIELSGDGLVVTITLLSGLADFATVSVADDVINTADAGDDRRVQTEPLTVGAATLITVEEITAEAGGLEITVRFSESVDPVGARSLVNYEINGVALVVAVVDEVTYDAGSMTTTIVLASGLADNATVSVAGGVITAVGASDDRRVQAASLTVGAATLITVEEITAEPGGLEITVRFSEPVDPVGARSLASYEIVGVELVAVVDEVVYDAGSRTVRIVLAAGEELVAGDVIRVVGGVISAVGVNDDRRVEADSFPVPTPAGLFAASVEGLASERVFTVTFTDRADPVSARNPASYQINDAPLVGVDAGDIVLSADGQTATITLLSELVGGDTISVVANKIKAAFDGRLVAATSFVVLDAVTATIAAAPGGLEITVTFSAPVNAAASGSGAANRAHYQINNAALPDDATVTYDAASRTTTIVLLSGLADFATVSVADDVINTADAGDDRRVQTEPLTVGAAVLITATIAADPGGLEITVRFSERVDPVGARSLANYEINGVALVVAVVDEVTYDAGSMTTTIVLLSGLADNATVSVAGGVITAVGANDDRRVQAASLTVGAATLITVEEITAEAGGLEITVRFSEPVDPVGARSLVNYEIDGVALVAVVDEVTYDAGSMTTRIVLAAGEELVAGDVIRVVGGVISAVGANDDRRVEADSFPVPTPTGAIGVARIEAAVGSREIAVVFTGPVNDAVSGDDFASSAANPANYEIDGTPLPAGTTMINLSADRMTATITLLGSGLPVVAGNTVSVVANQIKAAFDARRVAGSQFSLPVPSGSITATITASVGSDTVTVTFSAAVSDAVSGTGARNPANYRINRESRAGDYQLSADGTVLTIALGSGAFPTGLTDGSLIEVLGDTIKGAAASDTRRVDPVSVVVTTDDGVQPATAIMVTSITAAAGGLEIVVVFSAAVSDTATGSGARNPANYLLDGGELPGVTVSNIALSGDGLTARITLLPGNGLTAAMVGVADDAIKAANDERRVQGASRPVTATDQITVTSITATTGGLRITVVFSAAVSDAVSGSGARNPAHYRLDGGALSGVTAGDIALSVDGQTAVITLLPGNGLPAGVMVSVVDGVISAAGATDDRRVQGASRPVASAAQIVVDRIVAVAGAPSFTVEFSAAVSGAVSGSGARNLAHYLLDGGSLLAGATVEALTNGGTVATVVLPAGSFLVAGQVIRVVDDVISAAGDFDDRRVEEFEFTVPTPTGAIGVARIEAAVGSREIAVVFTGSVNDADSTDADNFATSARNPAHYQIDGGALPGVDAGDIALSTDSVTGVSTATITLLGSGLPVVAGNTISVVANQIRAAFDARLVAGSQLSLPVPSGSITATITASVGSDTVTVTFSAAVSSAVSATGARNPANYRINRDPLPGAPALSADGTVLTIALGSGAFPSGLTEGSLIEVLGNTIKGAAASDTRRVDPVSVVVTTDDGVQPATPIMVTSITALAGGLEVVVVFSAAVSDAVSGTGARNPANYLLDGGELPGVTVSNIALSGDGLTARITLLPGNGLTAAMVGVADDAIKAANDERRVQGASFPVTATDQITVTSITATTGGLRITVVFSAAVSDAVSGSGARNPAHYRLDGGALSGVTAGDIALSTDSVTAMSTAVITLLPGNGLPAGAMVSVVDGVISAAGATDDRRVQGASRPVAAAAQIVVDRIVAVAGESSFIVVFSEPVNGVASGEGGFATSARNPAHYLIGGNSVVGTTVGDLTDDPVAGANSVATVVLPAGSFLIAGQSIRVVDGVISAAGVTDDRRVEGFDFDVPVTAGAVVTVREITAAAGSREVTVEFTQPVNAAASGETDFASSAANPVNYEIDGVALAAATGFVFSDVNRTATITLLDTVLPVVAGNTVSVVANQIRAALDDRLVAASQLSLPVPSGSITATIAATVGSATITVTFSEAVSGAASGTAGFATSAVNPANYRINGAQPSNAPVLGLSFAGTFDGTTLTITLDSGLPEGSLIEVSGNAISGNAIKGAAASDARLVDPVSVVVTTDDGVQPAIPITTGIAASAGGRLITVTFSAPVNVTEPTGTAAAFATSALNLVHYRINGAALHADTEIARVGNDPLMTRQVTITLPLLRVSERLPDNATVTVGSDMPVVGEDTIKAVSDERRVEFASRTVGTASRIMVDSIEAVAGGLEITVVFSAAVNAVDSTDTDNFLTSAANPANYEIDDTPLDTTMVDEIAYDAGTMTATITLSSGSELVEGQVIRIVDGIISAAGAIDDRRVEPLVPSFTVPGSTGLFTATIAALASERTFTVTFTDRVDPATTGTGARNPAHYRIDPDGTGPLPAGSLPGVSASNIVLSADGRTATITLPSGSELAGGNRISIVANQIKAAFDGRLIPATTFDVLAAITATITAAAGGLEIVVVFDVAVNPATTGSGAANRAHYRIDGAALPSTATVTYVAATTTTRIILQPGDGLAASATITVADNVINTADANDDRLVQTEPHTVTPTDQITVTGITGVAGGLEIVVVFSAAVSDAVSGTGARNPANYRIASAAGQPATALPGVTADDIALSTDVATGVSTARITLPAGSELFAGAVISVVDDAISAAGALDDRRVEEFEFTVPTPTGAITATITAAVGSRTITVEFTQPVNDATSGETDFASSARNLANYEIDGTPLDAATTNEIAYDADTMTVTITLVSTELNPVLPVVAGNTVSVVDNQIRAAFDDRLVAAAERSFPATTTAITVTEITAAVGSDTITVTFSAAVSGAETGMGARNPAHYRVNKTVLVPPLAEYVLSADGTVLTITLPVGVTSGSLIEVLGGVIKGAAASDTRLVDDPVSVVVTTDDGVQPATPITATITKAAAGNLRITIMFSEPVNAAAPGESGFATSARNPAHYQIAELDSDGQLGSPGSLPGVDAGDIELSANGQTATITLQPGNGLTTDAVISVVGDAIKAASDERRVRAGSGSVTATNQITVEEITAAASTRNIAVRFSEPVNPAASEQPGFATSARNPANYEIDGGPLPADTTITLAPNGQVAVITLPPGEELVGGEEISVVAGRISGEATIDDRRVQATSFTVPTPITATITAAPDDLDVIVVFSAPVNIAADGDGFTTSARNIDNYQFVGEQTNNGQLPPDATFSFSFDRRTITISLPAGEELVGGETITVIGGRIRGADVDDRRVQEASFTVPLPPITATITAAPNERIITVTFTDPIDITTSGAGARNPAHYEIDGGQLPDETGFNFSDDRRTITITLPPDEELAGGETITVIGGMIKAADADDDRLVGDKSFTVPLPPITATITAAISERDVIVVFSAPVNIAETGAGLPTSARNAANYRFDKGQTDDGGTETETNDGQLPEGTTFRFSSDRRTITISLPPGEELVGGETISVIGGRIKGVGADTRRVQPASFTLPASITATIVAVAGELDITITFSDPVNGAEAEDGEASFSTSALNHDHYLINGLTLPGEETGTTIVLSNDGLTATISFPVGITDGTTIRIIGDVIKAADPADDRRVEATTFTLPITATIMAAIGDRDISVVFSAPVNIAAPGEAGFTTSARNPANYQFVGGQTDAGQTNNGQLPADTTFSFSPNRRAITISLPAGEELVGREVISVIDGRIRGAGADDRLVVGETFTVPLPPITVTITATARTNRITIVFSERISDTLVRDDFANSALNRANYEINGSPLDNAALLNIDSQRTATIVLVSGETLSAGDMINVVDGRIQATDDDRLVVANSNPFVVPPPPITATIRAEVGSPIFTVTFSDPVNTTLLNFANSAFNRANYEINGSPLAGAATVTLLSLRTVEIILVGDETFSVGDKISVVGGTIDAADDNDDRQVLGTTFVVGVGGSPTPIPASAPGSVPLPVLPVPTMAAIFTAGVGTGVGTGVGAIAIPTG